MRADLEERVPAHRSALQARRHRDKQDPEAPRDAHEAWGFDYRSRGRHDRDRLIYSAAFQRLAQVTQVTASESGHVFHNRLSHSLKVAQVGRSNVERLKEITASGWITGIARELVSDLDANAVEAGCLAHDLGHPPFGHVAEQELQALTGVRGRTVRGRFEGNAQSFRIVTGLEQTAGGAGFNLTRQALDTMLKYPWRRADDADVHGADRLKKWGYYDSEEDDFNWVREFTPVAADAKGKLSLEAHIMNWADDVTYAVHDVEDFYCAGLIPLHLLFSSRTDIGVQAKSRVLAQLPQRIKEVEKIQGAVLEFEADTLAATVEGIARRDNAPIAPFEGTDIERRQLRQFGSSLITEFLTAFRLETSPKGVPQLIIDDEARRKVEALKVLVHVFVIHRPSMAETQLGQRGLIRDLFGYYWDVLDTARDVRILPMAYRDRLESGGGTDDEKSRLAVDLVSSLTEDSAYRIHERITGRSHTSALV